MGSGARRSGRAAAVEEGAPERRGGAVVEQRGAGDVGWSSLARRGVEGEAVATQAMSGGDGLRSGREQRGEGGPESEGEVREA